MGKGSGKDIYGEDPQGMANKLSSEFFKKSGHTLDEHGHSDSRAKTETDHGKTGK